MSASMMLRYSFDLAAEADAVDNAVKQVLRDGFRTVDIMSEDCLKAGGRQVGCQEMGTLLADRI